MFLALGFGGTLNHYFHQRGRELIWIKSFCPHKAFLFTTDLNVGTNVDIKFGLIDPTT